MSLAMRIPFITQPHVGVVRLQGAIAAGGRTLSDASTAPLIEKAFAAKPVAVALEINCPGGSPVQSSLIAGRIRRLADEKKIPVVAFVEDVAASGGYWLASAADEIIADPTSIVGSIGVISSGFGAHEFIARHGIERRVHTAGGNKSFMDTFRPEKTEDVERLKGILDDMHEVFKAQVSARRGAKLADDPSIFTGEFWLAQKGIELGLVDGIGHMNPVMKERFGGKVKFRRYKAKRSFWQRFGAQMVQDSLNGIEERALYAQFGL